MPGVAGTLGPALSGKAGSSSTSYRTIGGREESRASTSVDEVWAAVEKVIALGGRLRKAPALYPSYEDPVIEWAVMLDPFGNEFCLIRDVPPRNGVE